MDLIDRIGYFLTLFSEHLLISFLAMLIVSVFGVAIGIWVFYSAKAQRIIMPTVNFLYTIPSIAMFGLLIPIVGIGLQNALIVLVLYGLLPIVHSTYSGMKEVPYNLVDAAKGLGSTQLQLFRHIYFPLALPSILSGLRITTVMVIALTGLAALIGAGGLGQAIFRGLNTMNTSLIVTGSLGISLFAILGDKFVGTLEKKNNLQRIISRNALPSQKHFIYINLGVLAVLLVMSLAYINPFASAKERVITIASKPMSEQYILGEIMSQLIENETDIHVIRQFGIGGGTTNIHPALLSGDLDMYVEYTGTAWMNVLNQKSQLDFGQLQQQYQENYQLKWLGLLGMNNTYAIAIPESIAAQKQIKTYSDLVRHSGDFDFGAEFEFFERADAYPSLIKVYPFKFAKLHEMDISLRYKAIEEGKVNAIDAFTTDAQIEALNLQVLVDDKHFFPDYEAGIVIREAILQQYPELTKLLMQLEGEISTDKMRKMNYQLEVLKETPKAIAQEFLATLRNKHEQ